MVVEITSEKAKKLEEVIGKEAEIRYESSGAENTIFGIVEDVFQKDGVFYIRLKMENELEPLSHNSPDAVKKLYGDLEKIAENVEGFYVIPFAGQKTVKDGKKTTTQGVVEIMGMDLRYYYSKDSEELGGYFLERAA